jgi:hypothetical protein
MLQGEILRNLPYQDVIICMQQNQSSLTLRTKSNSYTIKQFNIAREISWTDTCICSYWCGLRHVAVTIYSYTKFHIQIFFISFVSIKLQTWMSIRIHRCVCACVCVYIYIYSHALSLFISVVFRYKYGLAGLLLLVYACVHKHIHTFVKLKLETICTRARAHTHTHTQISYINKPHMKVCIHACLYHAHISTNTQHVCCFSRSRQPHTPWETAQSVP